MKPLFKNKKYVVLILVTILIAFSTQSASPENAEIRILASTGDIRRIRTPIHSGNHSSLTVNVIANANGQNHFYAGAFSGLSSVETLNIDILANNPSSQNHFYAGAFSGLSSLKTLNIETNSNNSMSRNHFYAGAFSGLSSLETLNLEADLGRWTPGGGLLPLPAGIFDGLSALKTLELIHELPLPSNVFSSLSSLTTLRLSTQHGLRAWTQSVHLFVGLSSLTTLDMSNYPLSRIYGGTFRPLSALKTLKLNYLGTTLGLGMFSSLSSLETFELDANSVTTLHAPIHTDASGVIGVFHGLSSLKTLKLNINSVTTLDRPLLYNNIGPVGTFHGLSSLKTLKLSIGSVITIPGAYAANLPGLLGTRSGWVDIFYGMSSLARLELVGNSLTSLPRYFLIGRSSLTALELVSTSLTGLPEKFFSYNPLPNAPISTRPRLPELNLMLSSVPFPITVSLSMVEIGRFKARIPTGAPFDINVSIHSTNGTINDGVSSVMIRAGSVESDFFTVSRTPGTSAAITVDIGTLPTLPDGHTGYFLVKSTNLPLEVSPDLSIVIPVCDRTPQVRDAIVAAVPGVSDCNNVTEAHLAAITNLNLQGNPFDLEVNDLKALKPGDFSGLSSLKTLKLGNNDLTTLPTDIFSGLSSLTFLDLDGNDFSSLPDGVFDELTSLTRLWLHHNRLTTLPEDIFDELTQLTELVLSYNPFAPLPAGIFEELTKLTELVLTGCDLSSLPEGIFDELTALKKLDLTFNQLSSLPEGIFDGRTQLTELDLLGNRVRPLPLTVLLEKVGEGQFKATAPTGAPFDIVLPLNVQNGSIDGGATTITIPKGSVESEPLTVTRTPSTNDAVTMDIGTLPSPPLGHNGYALVKSDDLPLEFTAIGITPVIERTPQVRDAIVRAFVGINSANDVTEAHLAAIKTLNLSDKSITALKEGDFDGLSALTALYLHSNQLTSLPSGVFDGLSALTQLDLDSNQLTSLPAGVFDGLSSVVVLGLSRNQLTSLPAGVFDELSALTNLVLNNNQLTSLPSGVFDGLSALTQLDLKRNQLTSLPTDVFDELSALTELFLQNNQLTSLSVGAFNGLSSLTQLLLNDNQLTTLPAGVFDGLSALTELWLHNNQLTTLSAGVFDGVSALTQLYLDNNQLTSLSSDVFDGLSALTGLLLNNNQLTSLSAGVFDGLPALRTLHLHNNQLTSLLAGTFDELPALKYLHLEDNRLASLSAGVFDGLSALTQLWLNANQLTSLSAGVFDRLSALTILYLHDNQLTTLSAGVFDGLSALTQLWLNGNVVAPMPLTVSLEQVGTDQFKAVAPAGAPFEIVLPVSVTNGSITGGATTITIPTGSVESDTLTVTRTAGTSDDITVDIGTVPGIPSNHNGYALVKSTDLPLTFTAPSETTTTLMAIKGTITADGTPAEAGLQVTVTIGTNTRTAVSEAGGFYSVIFLNTAVVATSGDTVTVQVLNPNTGEDTERTISLSSEQITAKQATIDLQFSPSGREYLLSVPEGISLIHVPLKVTAVDGATKPLESVGDLYDALGGATTVSLLITHDPQAERWVGYFGSGDRGSSADKVLTDDLGIIAVLTAATSVSLSGTALGTNGSSTITLHPGINLVGVPLKDSRITRVTDLFALEGIKDNVTLTIVSDNGEIKLVEQAGDSGDIPVTGGQSFILVARRTRRRLRSPARGGLTFPIQRLPRRRHSQVSK